MRIASPLQAQQAGISTVYQEVNLCPNLSVAENIFIGREPAASAASSGREMRQARRASWSTGSASTSTSPRRWPRTRWPCSRLVAIVGRARCDVAGAKVLILDEPTSSLDRDEVPNCSA